MKEQIKKVIQFNDHTLFAVPANGQWWVAIKPVCEALNVEYTRQFKNIKADDILGPALAVQPMQVLKFGYFLAYMIVARSIAGLFL